MRSGGSEHVVDELVDILLSVSPVASPLEGVPLVGEPSSGRPQLEGPDEVVGRLEVGAHGVDFVDQVLDAPDVVLAERLLDDGVAGEGDPLLVHLAEAPLVNQLLDGFPRGVPEGHVGLHSPDQVRGRLVHPHEGAVVELPQSEQPQDAHRPRVQLIDTPDSDHEGELGVGGHVNLARLLGVPPGIDLCLPGSSVLLVVFLGSLGDFVSLGFVRDFSLLSLLLESLRDFVVSLLFFDLSLGLGGHLHFSWHS